MVRSLPNNFIDWFLLQIRKDNQIKSTVDCLLEVLVYLRPKKILKKNAVRKYRKCRDKYIDGDSDLVYRAHGTEYQVILIREVKRDHYHYQRAVIGLYYHRRGLSDVCQESCSVKVWKKTYAANDMLILNFSRFSFVALLVLGGAQQLHQLEYLKMIYNDSLVLWRKSKNRIFTEFLENLK